MRCGWESDSESEFRSESDWQSLKASTKASLMVSLCHWRFDWGT